MMRHSGLIPPANILVESSKEISYFSTGKGLHLSKEVRLDHFCMLVKLYFFFTKSKIEAHFYLRLQPKKSKESQRRIKVAMVSECMCACVCVHLPAYIVST